MHFKQEKRKVSSPWAKQYTYVSQNITSTLLDAQTYQLSLSEKNHENHYSPPSGPLFRVEFQGRQILGSLNFGVVEFWGGRVSALSRFGVVEIWGRRVLESSKFGVIEIRGCRDLGSLRFGVVKIWGY